MQSMGLVVIMFFFGLAGGVIGRIKGSSFFIWFLVAGAIPFLGLLAAVFYRNDKTELRRQCPDCGRGDQAARRGLHELRQRARVPGRRDRAEAGLQRRRVARVRLAYSARGGPARRSITSPVKGGKRHACSRRPDGNSEG